jgi:membrane-associated phospholipid phosphatase
LFTPVLKTPPHPEYPSTHSTAAGSWAAVLAKYLGIGLSEKVPNGSYTVLTEGYFLPPRTYETLEAAEVEVGLSRSVVLVP